MDSLRPSVLGLVQPRSGWIKAIREALGMTTAQLAARMGIAQPTVAKLEKSEANERIQLDTLRRVADALECELVYALIPREPLDQRVERLRDAKAKEALAKVDHTMALERQRDDDPRTRGVHEERARYEIRDRDLWD